MATQEDCTDNRLDLKAVDRSPAEHKKEAERLSKMLEEESDPAKRRALQEKIKFHNEEVKVVDSRAGDDCTLMDAVARIRGDMLERRKALDNLAGTLYSVSSRLKRLEK